MQVRLFIKTLFLQESRPEMYISLFMHKLHKWTRQRKKLFVKKISKVMGMIFWHVIILKTFEQQCAFSQTFTFSVTGWLANLLKFQQLWKQPIIQLYMISGRAGPDKKLWGSKSQILRLMGYKGIPRHLIAFFDYNFS